MNTHPSTLELHRYRNGELGQEANRRVQDHIGCCPACAERLSLQESVRADFEREPVPDAIRKAAQAERERKGWLSWRWMVPALAAVSAVVGLFVLVPSIPMPGEGTPTETTRIKGAMAAMEVMVAREDREILLAPGSTVLPGDKLQIRFDPGHWSWASFAGRDGSGVVQVYQVMQVERGPMRAAPFALELDDTPGTQEIFAIFSDERPEPTWLIRALDGEAPLEGAVITSIRLHKEIGR